MRGLRRKILYRSCLLERQLRPTTVSLGYVNNGSIRGSATSYLIVDAPCIGIHLSGPSFFEIN